MRVIARALKCAVPTLALFTAPHGAAGIQDVGRVSEEVRRLLNRTLPGTVAQRDADTQYMILDVLDVTLSGDRSPPAAEGDGATEMFLSGPGPDGRVGLHPTRARSQEAPATGFLRSLGESTGRAFQLQLESDGPIRLSGSGIVVEPLVIRDGARQELERRITEIAARTPVTQVLNAYCLEFLKRPPSLNQVYRIASEQVQDIYAPAADILQASRALIEGGFLAGEPLDYVHSIKQWAIWAHEVRSEGRSFTFDDFARQFRAHAEDNFTVAGLPWSARVQALVESTLPTRYEHVGRVLEAAGLPLRSGDSN